MRCRAMPAAVPSSWPSSQGRPASTSSPRPDCTTTATTARPTGAHGSAVEEIATLFALDVTDGIDANDYSGPIVHRTEHRAGVIKIAGSIDGPSDRDRRVFEAAAIAHRRTGVPILTHCEAGTGALEQLLLLTDLGVAPEHIALSHIDKVVDRGYHRELLGFRGVRRVRPVVPLGRPAQRHAPAPGAGPPRTGWRARSCWAWTPRDAATTGSYGGSPGLTWLLDGFTAAMAAHGLDEDVRHRFFVDNPARAFAFAPIAPITAEGGT